MNVNKSKTVLIIFAILVTLNFSGCSCKPEVRYIDKPYEVKVPVKCVVPEANCTFNRDTDTEVIASMLECIIDMKHNEEVCK